MEMRQQNIWANRSKAILFAAIALLSLGCKSDRLSGDSEIIPEKRIASIPADIVSPPQPRLVEIYSSSCGNCVEMEAIMATLVADCANKRLQIDRHDISLEDNEHYLDEYGVSALPTFLFIDENEKEAARLVGKQTEAAMRQALAVLRNEECPGVTVLRRGING